MVEAPAPVLAAPVPVPVPVQVAAPVVTPPSLAEPALVIDVEPPLLAPPVEAPPVLESDGLFRAQATLLQAALRQADELTAALATEQQMRRQEIEHLTAENQILRDALATLNAQALQRQQEVEVEVKVEAAPSLDLLLPEQSLPLDAAQRHSRRRSAREAGPA